ncbi:MAG: four helix bundle protein [Blastocatellia bacterium]
MSENIVLDKSYKFALRVVRLFKYLTDEKKEYVLSRKLLNDGTDLGAHVKAAQDAIPGGGFVHEMSAALQNSSKVDYWLHLLRDGDFLDESQYDSISADNEELFALLTTIVKTSRGRQ